MPKVNHARTTEQSENIRTPDPGRSLPNTLDFPRDTSDPPKDPPGGRDQEQQETRRLRCSWEDGDCEDGPHTTRRTCTPCCRRQLGAVISRVMNVVCRVISIACRAMTRYRLGREDPNSHLPLTRPTMLINRLTMLIRRPITALSCRRQQSGDGALRPNAC